MIFTGMMVLQLLFVLFIMPETKGKSLEELESRLEKSETVSTKMYRADAPK
jgi:hypothetical protein